MSLKKIQKLFLTVSNWKSNDMYMYQKFSKNRLMNKQGSKSIDKSIIDFDQF